MPIPGIRQPEIIQIDDTLRLRGFDGVYDFALPWYQDVDLVYLVDGKRESYTLERLAGMYRYLDNAGELYFIEVLEQDRYRPIGDVTFWQQDMPIVIGEASHRGRGIGKKVVGALIGRGRSLGYDKLYVREIYDYNEASRRLFESLGFRSYKNTDAGAGYALELKRNQKRNRKEKSMNFRKIDKSNYMDCILLQVNDSQKHFVADNARSLVEAMYEDGLHTLGIYHGEEMIGFVLYDYDDTFSGWSMSRFMIGKQFQGRGFGKRAVLAFLDYFKEHHRADEIYISVSLENAVARKMYSGVGFKEIKEFEYTFDGHLYREIQMVKKL